MDGKGRLLMIGRRSLIGAAGLLAVQPLEAFAAGPKPKVAMLTKYGRIVLEMENAKAPITVRNFLKYVDNDYFTGGNIYRCIKQPGDPENGTVQGQPRFDKRRYEPVAHESTLKTGLQHDTGSISLARYAPGTATCDWFICLGRQEGYDAKPGTGGKEDTLGYAVFGQVIDGLDIVRKIHGLPGNGKAAFPEMKGQILTHPVPLLGAKRV
jgi:peptidyl-prolyl cis-trans isomerase A (cyclophilin A)